MEKRIREVRKKELGDLIEMSSDRGRGWGLTWGGVLGDWVGAGP